MGGIVVTNRTRGGRATLPRLEQESADVFIGSPLAVIGLWVFALRARFEPDPASPLPWVWSENLRPEDDEDGEPLPTGQPRKIQIESAYNTENSARNYRPSIVVGRGGGAIQAQKLAVDNKVGVYQPTQFTAYHCMATMPISLECESENAGESSSIAETVWAFILTTRDIFRHDFGLHDVTEPVLGDTVPHKKDKEIWVTPVQFSVSYDQRWGVTPIAPKLRDMALTLAKRDSPDNYFLELALQDDSNE